MTLVLPFGVDQIATNPLYSGSGNNQNSSMPCVYDNDAFERDFESAFMRDWASDISDHDMPTEDSPVKTPSDVNDLKRKSFISTEDPEESVSKKPRFEIGDITPVSPLSSLTSNHHCSTPSSPFLDSSTDPISTSTSSSSSNSSSSSSEGGQDDDVNSPEADDEDYMPRRRGFPMWNSRQRWKDERKRVMKMSVTKLGEIEDPELCLLRSVLINNTIKKLHTDIRNERQAKLRHKQQKIVDLFTERFPSLSGSAMGNSEQFTPNYSNGVHSKLNSSVSDFYDDSSCDEIFGISEEFLRVTIPDRRVSSPIPTCRSDSKDSNAKTDSDVEEPMEVVTTSPVTTASVTCPLSCYNNSSLPSCDTAVDCSSPFYQQRRTQNNSQQTVLSSAPTPIHSSPPSPSSLKQILSSVPLVPTAGIQCATQYRTNRDLGGGAGGDAAFPPRAPILDSVVYHSLLASLESS